MLTFGSAAWIEKKEAEEARRLLAMTIVSDIDQSLEVINNRLTYEDECRGISYYLMWNQHRLEENARSFMERQRKESVFFRKPVSNEEEYSLIMESDDMKSDEAVLTTCRRLLQIPRVQNRVARDGTTVCRQVPKQERHRPEERGHAGQKPRQGRVYCAPSQRMLARQEWP